jgi:hypothetical protein
MLWDLYLPLKRAHAVTHTCGTRLHPPRYMHPGVKLFNANKGLMTRLSHKCYKTSASKYRVLQRFDAILTELS